MWEDARRVACDWYCLRHSAIVSGGHLPCHRFVGIVVINSYFSNYAASNICERGLNCLILEMKGFYKMVTDFLFLKRDSDKCLFTQLFYGVNPLSC